MWYSSASTVDKGIGAVEYVGPIHAVAFSWYCWRFSRIHQVARVCSANYTVTTPQPFYHPGEPVPEEKFWTSWYKGRFAEADTETIRLGATPSGLTSAHLHRPPIFLQAGCPSCHPTNSVKPLKATSAFGLGEDARVLLNGVTCTVSVPYQLIHCFLSPRKSAL